MNGIFLKDNLFFIPFLYIKTNIIAGKDRNIKFNEKIETDRVTLISNEQ